MKSRGPARWVHSIRGSKAVRFQFIVSYRDCLSRSHLCRMMGVTDRGMRAWRRRPPSIRQRRDMVILAHIRDQHRLSLGSYGRPRMTEEMKELGMRVGQSRIGRVRRENSPPDCFQILLTASERHPDHSQPQVQAHDRQRPRLQHRAKPPARRHRPPLVQGRCRMTSRRARQTRSGPETSPMFGRVRAGSISGAVIIDLFARRIIGWAISNRMKQGLAIRTLNMAVALRRPPPG